MRLKTKITNPLTAGVTTPTMVEISDADCASKLEFPVRLDDFLRGALARATANP
jgi:hypothetical protein